MLKNKLINDYFNIVGKEREKFKQKAIEIIQKIKAETNSESIIKVVEIEDLSDLKFVATIFLDDLTFKIYDRDIQPMNVLIKCPRCKNEMSFPFVGIQDLMRVLYENSENPHICCNGRTYVGY